MTNFEKIKAQDEKYYLNTYSPYDLAFVSGDGCTLTDSEGKTYVDFLSGIAVNCLGYNHPVFVNAITEQAKKLTVCSNYYYSAERGLAAEQLVMGTGLNKVFFGNSGAEANECAIKLTRKYMRKKGNGKYKIVSALQSFHGRTLATVSATGQTKYNAPFAPLPAGFGDYVPYNDIPALERALADDTVAALLLEPIQGEGGIIPATQEYLHAARELTKKNGQLLILDEIQTGAARSGTFWAFEQYGITPDIATAAKGIGGGMVVSACMATDEAASGFDKGDHGTTFGACPLACAVVYAVCKELRKDGFIQHVTEMGEYLKAGLKTIENPAVLDIRGAGLMLGMELDETVSAKAVVAAMQDKGYILNVSGHNVLRFVPPLIIEKPQIDGMIAALREVL